MKTNNQKGSVLSIVEIIVVVILIAVGGAYYFNTPVVKVDDSINIPEPQLIGNDKDEHGCIPSAGYLWSDAKQACVRPWEENQATSSDPIVNSKIYSNPEYGFSIKYPVDGKINDVDITGGRSITVSYPGSRTIEIDVQNKMYGNQGSNLVPAQCNDSNTNGSNTSEVINGINFIKTDVSGDYGGMETASIAQSYCVVHNSVRYRLVIRNQYARYTNTDSGTRITSPDKNLNFQEFDRIVNLLDFKFTN